MLFITAAGENPSGLEFSCNFENNVRTGHPNRNRDRIFIIFPDQLDEIIPLAFGDLSRVIKAAFPQAFSFPSEKPELIRLRYAGMIPQV